MIPHENILLLGERNVGKTTMLKHIVEELLSAGFRVFVIDSATAHHERSLSVQISKQRSIPILDGSKIHDASSKCKITLYDVSHHLENSYNFPAGPKRDSERKRYIMDVQCILHNFIQTWDQVAKVCFVMDEIEIDDSISNSIAELNAKGCYFFNSLHPQQLETSSITNHFTIVSMPSEMCELF